MPGIGAVPTLAERELRDLLNRTQEWAAKLRKSGAEKRWDVLTEDFVTQIHDRINETHNEPITRSRLRKFASETLNLARDVTTRIAVCWKPGIRRFIDGADKDEVATFNRAYQRAKITAQLQDVNRWGWAIGPTIVVPRVRQKELSLDILLPHQYDAIFGDDDPLGDPIAVIYTIANGDNAPGSMPLTVVLDAESWRTFNYLGELVGETPHELGYFPGAVCRFDTPQDPDWYSATRNERLFAATIEIGYFYAKMNFVRKSQDKKLSHLFGDVDEIPKGQQLDPEFPYFAYGNGSVEFGVDDFDTSPENYIKQIRFTAESVTEGIGIPYGALSYDLQEQSGAGSAILEISYDALTTARNEQLPHADDFESELAWKANDMMLKMGHRDRLDLPKTDAVKEGFRTEWSELSRVDDPLKLAKLHDWQRKHGLVTDVDLYQKKHWSMSREECKEALMRNLEEQAEINDFVTSRNLNRDEGGTVPGDEGFDTAAEAYGAMGPPARGQVRNADRTSEVGGGRQRGSGRGGDRPGFRGKRRDK